MDDEPTQPSAQAPAPAAPVAHEAPAAARCLLAIGDLHAPRQHPDALAFLAAIKEQFAPDTVVSVGDETDFHGLSFHEKDPNLAGPSEELRQARVFAKDLERLFPRMSIVESNHGSLLYRRATAVGIPHEMVRSYNEVLQVGPGWQWTFAKTVETPSGPVMIEHGQKQTARFMSRRFGMSCIQGHRHSEQYAESWSNWHRQMFAVQTGCLVDNRDRGMWYNRNYREPPVLGSALVIDGEPLVIRLNERSSGAWDGRLAVARAA